MISDSLHYSDGKPITAICIVEDLNKCPKGFEYVSKIYDLDRSADLGRDSSFFAKKASRFLCFSKSETIANYVLEDLKIINEKELPPEGYGLIPRTTDNNQRAWRKKQLCYKLSRPDRCQQVIVDIVILLNRNKDIPDGFRLIGELNGLLICSKSKPSRSTNTNSESNGIDKVNGEVVNGNGNGNGLVSPLENRYYNSNHDYENLVIKPARPAPPVPEKSIQYNSNSYCQALQGVPFVLNTRFEATSQVLLDSLPTVVIKNREDIEKEYFYDFATEKQLCLY